MDIGTAIMIIGFVALAAAFCSLLIRFVFSEEMNSEIPPGVSDHRKLHMLHCFIVGIAFVGRILERLGVCHQVSFIRWCSECLMRSNRSPVAGLRIQNSTFAGVPVRIYEPTNVLSEKRRGLVYFHGGGWVLGSIELYDDVCQHIVKESETVVVSVGYRLAPEHRFPAALDDCELATRHFLSVAAEFNVDPFRVVLGGDSAGGNLAAALSQRLAMSPDRHLPSPCGLALIYPALQMADFNLPSYRQNHAVPLLFRSRMVFYYLQYLNGDVSVCQDVMEGRHVPAELKLHYSKWLDPSNLPPEFQDGTRKQVATSHSVEVYNTVKGGLEPGISPLLAEDEVLRLMPPTFILTCQYDVLRDDGILFRKRLQDLGVKVTWYNVPDGFHGVMSFCKGRLRSPAGVRTMEHIISYIKTL